MPCKRLQFCVWTMSTGHAKKRAKIWSLINLGSKSKKLWGLSIDGRGYILNKLTKLGRCDSFTIEWLSNRTARLLLGIQAQTARLHMAPLVSTWVHWVHLRSTWVYLGPLGSTWVHLGHHVSTWVHMVHYGFFTWVHMGTLGSTWVNIGPHGSTWIHFADNN